MKDYQQKRMKDYVLPQPVYRQALWAVKDLSRLRNRLIQLRQDAYMAGSYDFTAAHSERSDSKIYDITGSKAVEIANLSRRIAAIERAFDVLPEKYRAGIEDKLVKDMPYGDFAHPNTWKKWQQVFIYNVAVNLEIL